jgi:hypothetical protein
MAAEDAGEFDGGVAFVQPTEMSADEYLALMMSGPPDVSGVGAAAAIPIEDAVASPAEE